MTATDRRRGSALLAVLWLSAVLAAIAFSLSSAVRSETGRTSTAIDGLRAYYLAQGGVERAAMELLWTSYGMGKPRIPLGATQADYVFPSGNVHVEIIPRRFQAGRQRRAPAGSLPPSAGPFRRAGPRPGDRRRH